MSASWLRRFRNLFRSDWLASEARREMAFHIAERVDELVASGMDEAEARRLARRQFGRREDVRESVHRAQVIGWMESLAADLKYAFRAFRTNPGFAAVAILSLALGIGANTAIFSLINAVLLRPLPVQQPDELVHIRMLESGTSFTNPLWEEIRDRQETLSGVLASAGVSFNLTTGGVVRRAPGAWVSGDYFNVLGVPAAAGRVFSPSDDVRGCPATAVLSHAYWQREYGGEDVVGRSLLLGGEPYRIIGVAAAGFSGVEVGRTAAIFTPLCTVDIQRPGRDILDARSTWFISVLGRLKPGATLDAARAGLSVIAPAVFEAAVPTHWAADEQQRFVEEGLTAELVPNGLSRVRGQYREALLTLLVVVGVVLVIACANVAQLLLARATARQHEVAVRLAIGSGRGRLIRQLVTESLVLSLLGAGLGLLFARWSSGLVLGYLADSGNAVSLDLSLDLRVLAFTAAVAAAVGLLFGLAPAWRATRVAPQSAIRGSGRGLVGDNRQRFAKGIVVAQVALSLVLVVAAGLLVGSFRRLATVDPGFRADGVLIAQTAWTDVEMSDERAAGFPHELLERVRLLPGVRSASASVITPIAGMSWNDDVVFDGAASDTEGTVYFNGVSDGYMETFGTRLLAGRDFTELDRGGSAPVVLVNRTLAQRFFGEASPIGSSVRTLVHDSLGVPMEIVGVVEDAKYRQIDEETLPTAYMPIGQSALFGPSVQVAIRTEAGPTGLIPSVTEAMREIHPAITLEFETLEDQIAISLARPRLLATLSGFFGALALLLAVIGLYGTMSYSVARRRNEMGIRIALGAARTGIVGLVATEAGRIVLAGVIIGALLAVAATRLIASFLFGVTATDPVTLGLSALALAAVGLGAALIPAWRAASVDPMVALRED